MQHRGRLQAQGGNVEESEKWAQEKPLLQQDAHTMLNQLEGKLEDREAKLRREAFTQARAAIDNYAAQGGVTVIGGRVLKKSFFPRGSSDNRRVDIEVHAGTAFVP